MLPKRPVSQSLISSQLRTSCTPDSGDSPEDASYPAGWVSFKNNDTYRRVVNKGGDDNGPGFPPLATNGSEADSISKRHDPGIQ